VAVRILQCTLGACGAPKVAAHRALFALQGALTESAAIPMESIGICATIAGPRSAPRERVSQCSQDPAGAASRGVRLSPCCAEKRADGPVSFPLALRRAGASRAVP
jgi:hypothetical protein